MMNSPSAQPQQQQAPFREVPLQLDCPNPDCFGWLRGFTRHPVSDIPSYFKCSNNDGSPSCCTQKVILAKFSSKCAHCYKVILEQELITQADRSAPWVHCECYAASKSSTPYCFAQCLRCFKPINDELQGQASICGGKQGYVHLKCSNKRKLNPNSIAAAAADMVYDLNDDFTTIASSQDSSATYSFSPSSGASNKSNDEVDGLDEAECDKEEVVVQQAAPSSSGSKKAKVLNNKAAK